MRLSFDQNGNLDTFAGNPILLKQSMPENAEILQELEPYQEQLDILSKQFSNFI